MVSNLNMMPETTAEHPKASYKLYRTIKRAGEVGSNSFLYSDTKKRKFFKRKKCNINKTGTCF